MRLNPRQWQARLEGHELISHHSVPGTHDAATGEILGMVPLVRTQRWNFDYQLQNGVRYFDLRGFIHDEADWQSMRQGMIDFIVNGTKDAMTSFHNNLGTIDPGNSDSRNIDLSKTKYLVAKAAKNALEEAKKLKKPTSAGDQSKFIQACHGPWPIEVTFAEIFQTMYEFLAKNPTEFLMVQIGDENGLKKYDTDTEFGDFLRNDAGIDWGGYWRTKDTIPTVEELRGHIQLFRRFKISDKYGSFGIDVTQWSNASDKPNPPSGEVRLTVQDNYILATNHKEQPNLINAATQKQQDFISQMKKASESESDVLSINFATGVFGRSEPLYWADGWSGHAWDNEEVRALDDTVTLYDQVSYRGMNKFVVELIQTEKKLKETKGEGKQRIKMGVTLLDYINEELIVAIISTNYPYCLENQ